MTTDHKRDAIATERTPYELTQDDIRELLHYCHWIPAFKGLPGSLISNKYPGYDLGRILAVLKEAGALAKTRGIEGHFSGYRPRKRVEKVQIWPDGRAKVILATKSFQ